MKNKNDLKVLQKVKKNGIVFTALFEYDAAEHISESIIKSYYTPKKVARHYQIMFMSV